MGLGTVGGAFARALAQWLKDGRPGMADTVEIGKILIRHPERHQDYQALLTTKATDILDDPDIAVVVEVMGGMEPARSYMLEALRRGKAVVTANKEVVAACGPELLEASRKGRAGLYFEASVGAGIPVIQGLRQGLAGNRIKSITGVVNGTTNYILSRMTQDGLDFASALQEAQTAGYAEADPTDDVQGYDAARKIAILATMGFDTWVTPEDVRVEGIVGITPQDISYGLSQGWVLKLVAAAERQEGKVKVEVRPTFLPQSHPLAGVSGAYNAIWIEADPVGDVMYYGLGAGGGSTASAVLGDVLQAVTDIAGGRGQEPWAVDGRLTVDRSEDGRGMSYWRVEVLDRPGTLAQVAGALAETGVSLRSVYQRPMLNGRALLFLVHHECSEQHLRQARELVTKLPVVTTAGRPVPIWGQETDPA